MYKTEHQPRQYESTPSKRRTASVGAAALALVMLAGCSKEVINEPQNDIVSSVTYNLEQGTRTYIVSPPIEDAGRYTVLQYCIPGADTITSAYTSVQNGTFKQITDTPAEGKCEDGKLTPDDFALDGAQPAPSHS